ncbi:MAG: hypothetical protein J6M57_07450, partial [Acidaminococcaceae bacterium]|nr:hypothetical protein [Acidaminococcaceae bacterium]
TQRNSQTPGSLLLRQLFFNSQFFQFSHNFAPLLCFYYAHFAYFCQNKYANFAHRESAKHASPFAKRPVDCKLQTTQTTPIPPAA